MKQLPGGKGRNPNYLFNWIFVAGLVLLALNDHYLKQTYGNWVTGKLSDVAGLLIFPMFIMMLFPGAGKWSVIGTGLFFIFWKMPLSQGAIDIYNRHSFIPITRVTDYSDYIALGILPLSWHFIRDIDRYRLPVPVSGFFRNAAVVASSFVFMATQPTLKEQMLRDGDIHIGRYYRLNISKEQALEKIQAMGYRVEKDTATDHYLRRIQGYIVHDLVLDGGKDTIESLQFAFLNANASGDKSILLINNVKLKPGDKAKNMSILMKAYRRLIKEDFVEGVR